MSAEVWSHDPAGELCGSEFASIVKDVSGRVCSRMELDQRTTLEEQDREFIREKCAQMVQSHLHPCDDRRFRTKDRVVCRLAQPPSWVAGTIVETERDGPDAPTGRRRVPYLVKVDPPNGRLICVPRDESDVVRAEACFECTVWRPCANPDPDPNPKPKPKPKPNPNPNPNLHPNQGGGASEGAGARGAGA